MAYAQVIVDTVSMETMPIQNTDVTLGAYEGDLPPESFAVFSENSSVESFFYTEGQEMALNMEEVYQHEGESYYRYEMVFRLDEETIAQASEVRKSFWSLSADLDETDIQFMDDSVSVGDRIYEYDGDLKADLLAGRIDKGHLEEYFSNEGNGNIVDFSSEEEKQLSGMRLDRTVFNNWIEESGLNLEGVSFTEVDYLQNVAFLSSEDGFQPDIRFIVREMEADLYRLSLKSSDSFVAYDTSGNVVMSVFEGENYILDMTTSFSGESQEEEVLRDLLLESNSQPLSLYSVESLESGLSVDEVMHESFSYASYIQVPLAGSDYGVLELKDFAISEMQFKLENDEMSSEIVTLVSIMKNGLITEKVYFQNGAIYQKNVGVDGVFGDERTLIETSSLGEGWMRFNLRDIVDGIDGDDFRVFFGDSNHIVRLNIFDEDGSTLWGHQLGSEEVKRQFLGEFSSSIGASVATIKADLKFHFEEGLPYLADGESHVLGRVRFDHNDNAHWTLIAQREGDDVRFFYKIEVRGENGHLLEERLSWGTEFDYEDYFSVKEIGVPLDFISNHITLFGEESPNEIGVVYRTFDILTEAGPVDDLELVIVSYEYSTSSNSSFDYAIYGDVIEDDVAEGQVSVYAHWSVENVGNAVYLSKVVLEATDAGTEESIMLNVEKTLSDSAIDPVHLIASEVPLLQLQNLTESSLERILGHVMLEKEKTLTFLDRIYLENVIIEQTEADHHVTGASGSNMGFIETDVSHELPSELNLTVEGLPESTYAEVNLTDPPKEEGLVLLTHYEKGRLGDKFPIISLVSSLVTYGGVMSLFALYYHFFKKKKTKKIQVMVQFFILNLLSLALSSILLNDISVWHIVAFLFFSVLATVASGWAGILLIICYTEKKHECKKKTSSVHLKKKGDEFLKNYLLKISIKVRRIV